MTEPQKLDERANSQPEQTELPTPKRGALPTPKAEVEKAQKYVVNADLLGDNKPPA